MAQTKPKLIFDLDGTLLDVSDRHWQVYAAVVERFHGKTLDKATYWSLKRARTAWPDLLIRSHVDSAKLTDFMNEFIDLIEEPEQLRLDQLFPQAIDTLQALDGYQRYLVSLRRHEDRLRGQLDRLNLAAYFDKVLTGHTEGEGYELKTKIIHRLTGSQPAMVVGDTEADVLAAKVAGKTSVAVLSGIRNESSLRSLEPDFVIEDISKLKEILPQG